MEARLKGTVTPRYPCASVEFAPSISSLVFATFSYQWSNPATSHPALIGEIVDSFSAATGPLTYVVNRGDVDTRTGHVTQTIVAWWASEGAFGEWKKNAAVQAWISGQKAKEEIGYFHEIATFPRERWESLIAGPTGLPHPGVAIVAKQQPEEGEGEKGKEKEKNGEAVCKLVDTDTHDYLGGMRDRMTISVVDAMDSPHDHLQEEKKTTKGKAIKIIPPPNIAIIYSGQDWGDTSGEERNVYLKKVAPVLKKGLDYLNTTSLPTNCISARLLVEAQKEKSVGLSFFLSLADLEQWAWNHSTHGAIYQCFMNDYVAKNYTALKLFHEVGTVPSVDHLDLLYVNCHEATGFLPFFEHHVV